MGRLVEQWRDELLAVTGKFPPLDDLTIDYGYVRKCENAK